MGRKHDAEIADMIGKPIGKKLDSLDEDIRLSNEEFRKGINDIKDTVDEVIDDLSNSRKKELFDLNTLVDISTLEETEKRLLLEALYTLADMIEQVTDTQQTFIRSVQRYLGIKNVQTKVDLSRIENIDNIPAQKALLQTIMEFLFLENNDHSYMDKYDEVLSYFSVNKRGIQEIQSAISNIYTAVGAQGLSEKYGYIADEEVLYSEEEDDVDDYNVRIFYQKPICLVYTSALEDEAEYFLGVLNEEIKKEQNSSLPSPSRCELKNYERKREQLEREGFRIIMLGDSQEARKLYKYAKNGNWDYCNLGIKYVSHGNKTVILAEDVKNEEIDDLILLAKEVDQHHSIKIPSDVASVKYTFLKDCFEGGFVTPEEAAIHVVAGALFSPLLLIGQVCEHIVNGIQTGQNFAATKDLRFLQYCIAIYKYLESENAID